MTSLNNGLFLYNTSIKIHDFHIEKLKKIINMCETQFIYFNDHDAYIGNYEKPKKYNLDLSNIILGYPVIIDGDTVISKRYFDEIFFNDKGFDHILVNSFDKKSQNATIPNVIYQTFETKVLPKLLANAVKSWHDMNPEYSWKYYTDKDRREYIKKYFSTDVLKTYDLLIPGAYRADLWRYCVIYREGGVYVDIKMGAIKKLSELIDHDTNIVIVGDLEPTRIYNAFFAAKPKHPFLLNCIKETVSRVKKREYGINSLYPTGPLMMADVIFPILKINTCLPPGTYYINEKIQVYELKFTDRENFLLHILDKNGKNIISRRHSAEINDKKYMDAISNIEHYEALWEKRKIYRDEN